MAGPQLARDEAGNIWDVSDPANPRLAKAGQSSSVVRPAAPPEPKFVPGKDGYVYNPQTNSAQPIGGLPADQPKPTFIPERPGYVYNPQTNSAAPIPGLPQTAPSDQNSSATRATALQGYSYAKQLQTTIDDLTKLYGAGPGSTKGVHGLEDYLPYTANQAFDTKANAARGIVGQALGFTGGQLNTAAEAEKAVGPYLPQSSDRDEVIKQKIQTLQQLADEAKAKSIQQLGGEPDPNGNIVPVQPQVPAAPPSPPPAPPAPDQVTNATGATRDEVDPVLKGVAMRVGQMLSNGAPGTQIEKYLRDNGIPPESTDLAARLKYRGTPEFKRWQRANPGAPYPMGPSMYTKQVPMSGGRQFFNRAAATDSGGDAASFFASSANAITGGRLDDLTGPNGQVGMDLLRANHPKSSFAGDLAGQASVEALASTVPGARALMATRYGRRGADIGYGLYSGSGEGNDDPLRGALTGAGINLAGGMFGRGAQRGLGRAATGVQNANLRYLDRAGIPLSVGRIARGADNDAGRAIGGIEDRLAGLPGMDAVIGDVRQQGDRAFNRAAFSQMPGHSGETGAAGLTEGHNLVNQAYSFLDHAQIPADATFRADMAAIRRTVPNNLGAGVLDRLATIDNAIQNNQLTGRAWQDAIRGIRADRASLRGQPFSDHAIQSLDDAEGALMGLATRGGPPNTAQHLTEANRLNSQFKTLASALDNGPAQKAGEVFSAGRLDDASRANARRFGGQTASLTGNRPFYDLTTAGKEVMPNLTPDSGTAGRLAVLRGLGTAGAAIGGGIGALTGDDGLQSGAEGGGIGTAGGLTLAALLMAPYSRVGQRGLQRALLAERPRMLEDFGNFLVRRPRVAGMFGSAVGRDYFMQPELEQGY